MSSHPPRESSYEEAYALLNDFGKATVGLPDDIRAMISDHMTKVDLVRLLFANEALYRDLGYGMSRAFREDILLSDDIPDDNLLTAYGDTKPKLRGQVDTVTFTRRYVSNTPVDGLETLAAQVSDDFVNHHLSVLHVDFKPTSRGITTPSPAVLSSRFSGNILLLSGMGPKQESERDSDPGSQPCLFKTVVQRLEVDNSTGIRDYYDDETAAPIWPMEDYVLEDMDGPPLVLLTTASTPDERTVSTLSRQAMMLLMFTVLRQSDQPITWAWDSTLDDHIRIKEKVMMALEADTGSAQIRQHFERRFKVCSVDEAGVDAAVSLLERTQDWRDALREEGFPVN